MQLRDALFAAAAAGGGADDQLARRIAEHVDSLDAELGGLGVAVRPSWFGRSPVVAAHFVGRVTDMWGVHSALTAADVGLITVRVAIRL